MPNFFEKRRIQLGLSQRGMASRLGISNTAVSVWEGDEVVPNVPISRIAKEYEITEQVAADQVMALRLRIESRKAKLATSK